MLDNVDIYKTEENGDSISFGNGEEEGISLFLRARVSKILYFLANLLKTSLN